MLCENVLGNYNKGEYEEYEIDFVDFEWHETFKKLHKKISHSGKEIGIRLGNEVLTKGIKQGDILYKEGNYIAVVNILPCDVIVINVEEHHKVMAAKVCYEIGNRHATLFWGEKDMQYMTPYNEPMLEMLKKIHGVTVEVKNLVIDFNKSISATVNNHTHSF